MRRNDPVRPLDGAIAGVYHGLLNEHEDSDDSSLTYSPCIIHTLWTVETELIFHVLFFLL